MTRRPFPFPSEPNGLAGRVATVAAALGWAAFPVAIAASPKLVFLEGDALLACTSYGLISWIGPGFARRTLVGYAFFFAMAAASNARQAVFEYRTVGHLTGLLDSCAMALAPLGLAAVAFVSLFTALVLTGLASVDVLSLYVTNERPTRTLRRRLFPALLTVAAIGGAITGALLWQDWQIDRPCV